jgi:hypothetical protein
MAIVLLQIRISLFTTLDDTPNYAGDYTGGVKSEHVSRLQNLYHLEIAQTWCTLPVPFILQNIGYRQI